jgi:hypothetical protein
MRSATPDVATRSAARYRRAVTRAEAEAFRKRWQRVERAELAALRRSSMDDRLRTLAALMASARTFRGTRKLAAEDAMVRRRWSRLRQALGG